MSATEKNSEQETRRQIELNKLTMSITAQKNHLKCVKKKNISSSKKSEKKQSEIDFNLKKKKLLTFINGYIAYARRYDTLIEKYISEVKRNTDGSYIDNSNRTICSWDELKKSYGRFEYNILKQKIVEKFPDYPEGYGIAVLGEFYTQKNALDSVPNFLEILVFQVQKL